MHAHNRFVLTAQQWRVRVTAKPLEQRRIERIVERGKLYLYHIVDELEKRGMLNFYYRQAA